MIKYKRIFSQDGLMRYEFYPEGDISVPGIVEFEPNKEPRVVKQSLADFKMFYANHALRGIDTTRESGFVAWY